VLSDEVLVRRSSRIDYLNNFASSTPVREGELSQKSLVCLLYIAEFYTSGNLARLWRKPGAVVVETWRVSC